MSTHINAHYRPSPYAIEVARIIERSLKDSKAIDTEALCILAGEKVFEPGGFF